MTSSCDEGQLRAYLDGELAAAERADVGAHIAGCVACRANIERQRALAAQVRTLLAAPAPAPQSALNRLRAATAQPNPAHAASARPKHEVTTRRAFMESQSNRWAGRRSWLAGLAAIVAIASLLALPPVRAAADNLLSVFRVQKVVFMPIDPGRIKQLQDLNLNREALFIGKPNVADRNAPQAVATAAEAASAVGYAVAQPAQLPSPAQSSEFMVLKPGKMQFQINVATARQALELLDIRDVAIPDSLGAQPIVVESQPFVAAHYHGANYDLTLNQGRSPNVTLPEGVDLALLGKAALRVLGMSAEQAEIASRQINWNTTLIFPFPADANNIRQVTVAGEPALLVNGGPRSAERWQLYWQAGDRLYMLAGSGDRSLGDQGMIDLLTKTAESVQ